MGRARSNPEGIRIPARGKGVKIGKYGTLVHCWVPPMKGVPGHALCRSGEGRAREKQKYYEPEKGTEFITCYRCGKLMTFNLMEGRPAWKRSNE